jgi:hypothetical protein
VGDDGREVEDERDPGEQPLFLALRVAVFGARDPRQLGVIAQVVSGAMALRVSPVGQDGLHREHECGDGYYDDHLRRLAQAPRELVAAIAEGEHSRHEDGDAAEEKGPDNPVADYRPARVERGGHDYGRHKRSDGRYERQGRKAHPE